jgi:hypothetical protein
MQQPMSIGRAAARGDEGRLASLPDTRFGSATFAAKRAARTSPVDAVCVNTSAQSEYRGATAGVFTHASARAFWS